MKHAQSRRQDFLDGLYVIHLDKHKFSVVVFPSYSNFRRYLIHRACEPYKDRGLATFSIGEADQRRTVLCHATKILTEFLGSTSGACEAMGVDSKRKEADQQSTVGVYRPPPLRKSQQPQQQTTNRDTPKKEGDKDKETQASVRVKRPDREVYVPRQRRSATGNNKEETSPSNSNNATAGGRNKQRNANKSYCNVYTPPHARTSSRAQNTSIDSEETTSIVVTNCTGETTTKNNRKRQLSDNENGVDSIIVAPTDFEHTNNLANDSEEHMIDLTTERDDVNMSNDNHQINGEIVTDPIIWNHSKDEDTDQTELKRATQEINRSNRRLIKQSFVSDVLIISNHDEDDRNHSRSQEYNKEVRNTVVPESKEKVIEVNEDDKKRKEVFNAEEEEWEAMLCEDGHCLEPSMLTELNNAVGRVTIQTPRTATFSRPGPDKDPFSHVLEVYNFPTQFTNNDLLSVFSDFKDTGFEIKWVDDTHALAVFSSAKIAEEVLAYNHPMVRTRPLHEATQESRQKAKKCAEYLQPYRARPETCPALARRLVTGALGVRLPTMSQERIQEKKVLSEFKEKKRMETQKRERLREAAWDGSLGNTTS